MEIVKKGVVGKRTGGGKRKEKCQKSNIRRNFISY